MTTKLKVVKFCHSLLFSLSVAAPATLLIFESIPPSSMLNRVIFDPKMEVTVFHFHFHGHSATRLMFIGIIALLGVGTHLALTITLKWNSAILRCLPGPIAILAPLVGWLVLIPHVGVAEVGVGVFTCLILSQVALYLWRDSFGTAGLLLLPALVAFGLWLYLYLRNIDPMFLVIPVLSAFSYTAWVFYLSCSEEGATAQVG